MELHTIGIDLGKTVFHLVGLNLRGEVVVRKKFSRKQLLHFTANLQFARYSPSTTAHASLQKAQDRGKGDPSRLDYVL
jgi:hypothetical protein